jgi:2-oxoglutarate ferredoxin oxidoreductase subunit alpha
VATPLEGHIVEIVGDADDGALRCGQSLAAIALRMGNGLWTTQIAAEIQPPAAAWPAACVWAASR